MSDGPKVPANADHYTDCLTNRVAPGEGEFDVSGFIAALRTAGAAVNWSLEVCSADGWANPGEHVERIATGMRQALAER